MEGTEHDTIQQSADGGQEESASERSATAAELQQALAGKESEIAGLKREIQALEERALGLGSSLSGAVAAFRAMVVRAHPDILPELIVGDSIAAVRDSLERAKAVVNKVRQDVEVAVASGRFPPGAPQRGAASPDLSPREKIEQGISRRDR